jgi:hypothetical protein
VKFFGKNVSPLTSLLKNNSFFYSVVIEHSFSALKDSLSRMGTLPSQANFGKICLDYIIAK